MKKLSALIGLALVAAPTAYAQDGSSCAAAIPLAASQTITIDTTGSTNWAPNYGPLGSQANDVMYTFTTGDTAPTGTITVTAGFSGFAMYLLNACAAAGGQPSPIATTGTVGGGLNLGGANVAANTQYWVAVTGTAASGSTGNGAVTFTTPTPLPVTLQTFSVE